MAPRRFARLTLSSPPNAPGSLGTPEALSSARAQGVFVELEAGCAHVLSAAPWLGGERTGQVLDGVDDAGTGAGKRLAPVAPGKILCVGRNYREHAAELGNVVPKEPLLFLKPTSSLVGPDEGVELPPPELSSRVEHEVELAVVLGRRLRRASEAEAEQAIFGLTLACDVTARDLQKADGQWTRAKGMDTFCPVGPVVVSGLSIGPWRLRCWVGEELRQDGTTADMVFSLARVLAYASQAMTLEAGDLILTGTPPGVGPLRAGDTLRLELEGVGAMSLEVRGAK